MAIKPEALVKKREDEGTGFEYTEAFVRVKIPPELSLFDTGRCYSFYGCIVAVERSMGFIREVHLFP